MKRLPYLARTGLLLLFCLAPVVFAADGFGINTTGGEGGTTAIVDNAVDFKELVETADVPYVVRISGEIDLGSVGGKVRIHSNKTIQGMDPNANFNSVKDPYYIYISDPGEIIGKIRASNNVFDNCTGRIDDGDDDVFMPPYSYTMDNVLDVPTFVRLGAGAGGVDFFPHWLFGLYGDFDRNGTVDTADLSQFVDYWLGNKIADADYNQDGIVNSLEFAIFAGNWLQTISY